MNTRTKKLIAVVGVAILIKIAHQLGKKPEQKRTKHSAERLKRDLELKRWCDENGIPPKIYNGFISINNDQHGNKN